MWSQSQNSKCPSVCALKNARRRVELQSWNLRGSLFHMFLECSFSAARCERFTTQQWPCFVQRKQRLLHEAERRRDWCDAFVSCQTSGASIHGLILQDQRFLKIQIIQRIEEELRRQIQEERKEQTMIPCMRYDTVDGDEMMVPQLPGPPS